MPHLPINMRRRHKLSLSDQDLLPVGTTFDFNYTGAVKSIDLPKGYYKLQAWGAQGGNVTGSYSANGSKGGYSEGILKLDEPKTLHVFVGGQGTSYTSDTTSTTIINGGWNGGGCGVRYSSYESGDEFGKSYPRPGGGATDFALVTSDMSYSSSYYRNNRSADSLNSRILVAGGGAGASYGLQKITAVGDSSITLEFDGYTEDHGFANGPAVVIDNVDLYDYGDWYGDWIPGIGETIEVKITSKNDYKVLTRVWESEGSTKIHEGYAKNFSVGDYAYKFKFNIYGDGSTVGEYVYITVNISRTWASSTTDNNENYTTGNAQGGGTSGKGQYPGTQSSAGISGVFGFGANQNYSNYMYCAGGGGGGWYGGGTSKADSNISYINYCGGGSGFVNIPSNAQYRPSGYTGLELESGQTIAGNTSFPSINGGTEVGHSGDGFARITVLDDSGGSVGPSIEWTVQTGSWTSLENSNAYDGLMWVSNTHTDSGSTVIRCTFRGITNIKFRVLQDSEYNYDYLTAGKLDTPCTRSSYSYTFKGLTSTEIDECQYSCDSGEHFVEFCYSKDGSSSYGEDNARVCISAIS